MFLFTYCGCLLGTSIGSWTNLPPMLTATILGSGNYGATAATRLGGPPVWKGDCVLEVSKLLLVGAPAWSLVNVVLQRMLSSRSIGLAWRT
ncbi:MAG: hypothetical protein ACKESB_02540 [Candidatus Hodgkinia cicadicola]